MSKMLIVVDMQNDFVTGSLANQTALEVIPFIKSEIESGKYSRVLFTQDTHYDNYLETQEGKNLPVKHCIFGTKGWDVVDELKEYVTNTNSIKKFTFGFNGWNEEEFGIADVDEVVFVGICTDICVVSNVLVLKTMYPEMKVTVLAKGCAGLTPETHNAALETMKSCQVNVVE
jgi:nicotinamidase-related amidase